MILHIEKDLSVGYEFEIDDFVKLSRDIFSCSGVRKFSKGMIGKVKCNKASREESWMIRSLSVQPIEGMENSLWTSVVQHPWFFEPLTRIIIDKVK